MYSRHEQTQDFVLFLSGLTSVCESLARSTFCASAQTDSLGTAKCGLSFDESFSFVSCEQSCEELHFFLSSAANCCCWFAFPLDRPQPAVRLPRREKARITIGDDGTLFGLKIWTEKKAYINNTCLAATTVAYISNNWMTHWEIPFHFPQIISHSANLSVYMITYCWGS